MLSNFQYTWIEIEENTVQIICQNGGCRAAQYKMQLEKELEITSKPVTIISAKYIVTLFLK